MDLGLTIYTLCYVLLFLYLFKNRNSKVALVICGIWLLSTIASNLYYYTFYILFGSSVAKLSFPALMYLFCGFFISLYPFIKIKDERITKIKGDYNILLCLSYLIIIISIVPFFGNIIYFISNFKNLASNYGEGTKILTGLIGTLNDYNLYLRVFVPPLIIYMINKRANIYIIIGLCAGFLNPIISNLNIGSRYIIIIETAYFLCIFFLLKNTLDEKVKKRILQIFTIASVVLFIGLILSTIARFEDDVYYGDNAVMTSIYLYGGEGPINFSSKMWGTTRFTDGDNCFFIFKYYLGLYQDQFRDTFWVSSISGLPLNTFFTYIADFYIDLGPIGAYILLLLLSAFTYYNVKRVNITNNFTNIIWIAIIIRIIASGFTYYPYMNAAMEILYAPALNMLIAMFSKSNRVR